MRAVLLLLALPLAACGGSDGGTSFTFTGNGADGNRHGAAMDGASGQVKIDVPGFQGSFKLPKVQLTADNFDLNGVHLPPGSKIRGFDVEAGGGDKDDGRVRVSFDAPTDAAAVRAWFAERLPKVGFTVRDEGAGLAGTTDDHKPFALGLDNAGAGRATGTITIG